VEEFQGESRGKDGPAPEPDLEVQTLDQRNAGTSNFGEGRDDGTEGTNRPGLRI
jgi:hypothetical protein